MSLFRIEFNKRELITLRIIFNSNSGLNKVINAGVSLDEIKSLNRENLESLRFRNHQEILNKLQDYELYESKAINTINWCEQNSISILSIFDENYPKKLSMLKNPPCLLFCSGNVSLLNMEKSIAIIGSRNISNYGKIITEKTTSYFAKNGANIVSGLAKGVDTHAHQSALNNNAELYNLFSSSNRSIPDNSWVLSGRTLLAKLVNCTLEFGHIEGYAASGQIISDGSSLFNMDNANNASICSFLNSDFHRSF